MLQFAIRCFGFDCHRAGRPDATLVLFLSIPAHSKFQPTPDWAGVSLVFLRSHPDLLQAIEEAGQQYRLTPPVSAADKAKDQVIAALRRRLDEMKQQIAAKDRELHGKQREVDRLYGKLAAASPFTDAELRIAFTDALNRLAQ